MRRAANFRTHRAWCSLWAGEPRCDCGGVDVVDLVEWWVDQARTSTRAAA